jgi:hypothetical protein
MAFEMRDAEVDVSYDDATLLALVSLLPVFAAASATPVRPRTRWVAPLPFVTRRE